MNNLKFKIADIKLLRSEVRDHPIVLDEDFTFEYLKLEVNLDINYQEKFVLVLFHFGFEIEIEDEKYYSLGHFDIIYTFEVPELKEILTDEKRFKVLILNIISIAYSTSRGVIFSETKSFALNKYYLGPISANDLYDQFKKQQKSKKSNPTHSKP